MCNYDYDDPSIYNETDSVARKHHRCSECGRIIQIKEKYRNHFGVWEGRPHTFKTCSHCLVAQNFLREQCGSFIHGQLEEEIYEHADYEGNFYLYRLLVGIRRQWKTFKSDYLMKIPNPNKE